MEEGQTTQWPKETKGAIRSKWKDRQHNGKKIPKGQSEVVNGRTENTEYMLNYSLPCSCS